MNRDLHDARIMDALRKEPPCEHGYNATSSCPNCNINGLDPGACKPGFRPGRRSHCPACRKGN